MASQLSLLYRFIADDQVELFEGGLNDPERHSYLLGAGAATATHRIHELKKDNVSVCTLSCDSGVRACRFFLRYLLFNKGEAGLFSEVIPRSPCILRQGVCSRGRGLCAFVLLDLGFPRPPTAEDVLTQITEILEGAGHRVLLSPGILLTGRRHM